jgi:hypothetical protein
MVPATPARLNALSKHVLAPVLMIPVSACQSNKPFCLFLFSTEEAMSHEVREYIEQESERRFSTARRKRNEPS